MESSKQKFLNLYRHNVKMVDLNELKYIDINDEWKMIFSNVKVKERISDTIKLWNKYMEAELKNTINYFQDHLVGLDLLKCNDKYSVLYNIKTLDGEIEYYEGRLPLNQADIDNENLNKAWMSIPESIRKFYTHLHNGFYFYASNAMGIVSIKNMTYFADDEWGIIEELEEPVQIDLTKTFGFFHNGMGGYVAVDDSNCVGDNAVLWFSNKAPIYTFDAWDIVAGNGDGISNPLNI